VIRAEDHHLPLLSLPVKNYCFLIPIFSIIPATILSLLAIKASKSAAPFTSRITPYCSAKVLNSVIDTAAGKVAYAVLSVGQWLGLREKLFAIPWRTLQQSAGFGTFTLDIDKETLQKAPGFDPDRWPNRANTRWAG
jgi:hypothetical protein